MAASQSNIERAAEQRVMSGVAGGTPATGTASGHTGATPAIGDRLAPGSGAGLPSMAGASATGTGTCGRQYFTTTEDRPVVREQVTIVKEHHPVQKEFVVEAKATGREREVVGSVASEVIGTTVREIPGQTMVTQAAAPTIVAQPAVASATQQGFASQTTTATTGTTAPMGSTFRAP